MKKNKLNQESYLLQHLSLVTDEIFFVYSVAAEQFLILTPAFDKICNMPSEGVNNNPSSLLNLIHPDDKEMIVKALSEIKFYKKKLSLQFRILPASQPLKWIHTKVGLLQQEEQAIVIGIARDISLEKEYNETLYKYFDKKNSVLDILSHDLASPLRNIYTYAKVLLDPSCSFSKEDVTELLERVEETSRNGMNLIQALFNKEFIDISDTLMLKQRTDIVERIREIINIYQRSNRMIAIKYHFITSSESIYINADVIKIMQAVHNLVSNAQKFTRDNGNITIEVAEIENEVIIKVRDDGIGVPAEMVPFLFDKYSKAKRIGLRAEPTTGLGLFLIKNIVEWHNGRVWYEAGKPDGSVFCIALPSKVTLESEEA